MKKRLLWTAMLLVVLMLCLCAFTASAEGEAEACEGCVIDMINGTPACVSTNKQWIHLCSRNIPDDALRASITGSVDVDTINGQTFAWRYVAYQLSCPDEATNLKGLELFEISILSIGNVQMQEIDLSNMPSIWYLVIISDHVETLILENNANMVVLSAWCPKLKTLRLGYMECLESISCERSGLEELDLSNCPNLLDLSCYENQLTRLDLSANTNLTSISCRQYLEMELTTTEDGGKVYVDMAQIVGKDYISRINSVENAEYDPATGIAVFDGAFISPLIYYYSTGWNDSTMEVQVSLPCVHLWQENPCTGEKTCTVCGEVVAGDRDDHIWTEATCFLPKICTVCGIIEGEALGHEWNDEEVTCGGATCAVCGYFDSNAGNGNHMWNEVTCSGATCAVCGYVDSNAGNGSHQWSEATCWNPKFCLVCGITEGEALEHEWSDGEVTCAGVTCSVCGYVDSSAGNGNHQWSEATCWNPKFCFVCGITEGEALEHELIPYDEEYWECKLCGGLIWWCIDHELVETGMENVLICTLCDKYVTTGDHEHLWVVDTDDERYQECLYCEDSRCNHCDHQFEESEYPHLLLCKICNFGWITGHTCVWEEATCQQQKYCILCSLTEGEPIGHSWIEATCTEPKKCSACGLTEGAPLSHEWADATCAAPKKCRTCGLTEGDALDHRWKKATCTTPRTCMVCGTTEGNPTAHVYVGGNCKNPATCRDCGATGAVKETHVWKSADCTAPRTCTVCDMTEGKAVGHKFVGGNCKEPSKCKECGAVGQVLDTHNWKPANCRDAKTCRDCGMTEGEPEGHTWLRATCIRAKTCSVCGETDGKPEGHIWKSATCQEPKTCTACDAQEGDVGEHKRGPWHVDKSPTADEEGSRHRNCQWCDREMDRETLEKLEQGKVENYTDPQENDYAGQVEHTNEELSDKLLTEEEKERVEQGEQVSVSVTVEDIQATLTEDDEAQIAENLGENTVGLYLDITVIKQVGDEQPQEVTQTNGALTVTIDVPEELKNTDPATVRRYKIIRVHEGEVSILDAVYDEESGKLSFETDAFSTYTLVYADEEVSQEPEQTAPTTNGGQQGSSGNGGVLIAVISVIGVAVIGGIAVLIVLKKKK